MKKPHKSFDLQGFDSVGVRRLELPTPRPPAMKYTSFDFIEFHANALYILKIKEFRFV